MRCRGKPPASQRLWRLLRSEQLPGHYPWPDHRCTAATTTRYFPRDGLFRAPPALHAGAHSLRFDESIRHKL
eukprot:COSAG01_NODE_20_length_38868_cov_34.606071_26_plen_72_part_00